MCRRNHKVRRGISLIRIRLIPVQDSYSDQSRNDRARVEGYYPRTCFFPELDHQTTMIL